VKVTTPTASCPTCAQPTTRRHSHYRRTLADLPWATVPVRLHFHVRRFFCDIPACGLRAFTERVPTVARPYAHPTCAPRPYSSMSVMKVAGLAAVELWIRLRMVLPTVDTSSSAPRRWGLLMPVSGLGVNRMFP